MTIGIELYLRVITDAVFIVIGLIALSHFLRIRDTQHLYFALLCGTLAACTLVSEAVLIRGHATLTESRLFALAIAPHPYLLLRIAHTIRPFRGLWLRLTEAGLIYTFFIILSSDISHGGFNPAILLSVLYFVGGQLTAAFLFLTEMRAMRGVSRQRYFYIFAGSVLLAGVVLMLVIRAFFDPYFGVVGSGYTVLAAMTAAAYFIGFAPPKFVRRAWQSVQIIHYQNGIIGRLINQPAERILRFLARSSLRAVDGKSAIIMSYDTEFKRLSLNSLAETVKFTIPLEELNGFAQFVEEFNLNPKYIRRRDAAENSAPAGLMDGFGARAMFSVPVINMPHALTILVITLRSGTLFVEDDLATLRRFAQQARAVLQNNSLIAVTQDLVEELRDETGDLEEMVIAREEALRASEDELRRRLMQTSALYKELEAFSYSVSHDLRAPLRAINGFSTALSEDFGVILPPEALDYVQRISANSHKMEDLMNDMLKLSQLSRTEMAFVSVDLTDIAVRVGHELRALYPAHEVNFSVDSGLTAQADPVLAKILLTNLLGNAWKFTLGTPEPTVSLKIAKQNGETVYRISDNGAGFDMEYAEKLFKPFQRLHTSEAFAGSGIGLAIVQRIVNRHGGRVWAEGQTGKGAHFYFTLPGRVT